MLVVSVVTVACAGPEPEIPIQGNWVGTITTEGDVTTVATVSGSVWGGTATLIEEASIGVYAGGEPYMLGRIRGITADNRRIYLVDSQVPALRVYDWDGNHLRDLGGEGQGPGEFQDPVSVGVDRDGRVWLHEPIATRLVVFESDGAHLKTFRAGSVRTNISNSMVVSPDGIAYVFDLIRPTESSRERQDARVPVDVKGVAGEPFLMPRPSSGVSGGAQLSARAGNATRFGYIPFYPRAVTAFSPALATLVGVGKDYRFEVHYLDGRRLVAEKNWEPVAVLPGESEAHEQAVTRYLRATEPGWVWNGPPIPETKPAFSRLVPARTGETWVVRPGPATHDPDCEEESFAPDGYAHCWPTSRIIDVFDAQGRYLGDVDVPAGFSVVDPMPFISGTDVIAHVEDQAGTPTVKRYRLALPGERLLPQ